MAFYISDAEDQLLIPTTGHGASFIEYFLENKFYTFFLHEVLSRIPTKGFYVKTHRQDKTQKDIHIPFILFWSSLILGVRIYDMN